MSKTSDKKSIYTKKEGIDKPANVSNKKGSVAKYVLAIIGLMFAVEFVVGMAFLIYGQVAGGEPIEIPQSAVQINEVDSDNSDDSQMVERAVEYLRDENYNYPSKGVYKNDEGETVTIFAPLSGQQTFTIYGVSRALLFAIFFIGFIKVKKGTFKDLGFKKSGLSSLWQTLPAYVVYVAAANIVFLMAGLFLSDSILTQEQQLGFEPGGSTTEVVLAFIALVIIAPVAEEVLFRGYLFKKIKAAAGYKTALVVSSMLFGLVHLQFNIILDTAVFGLFLAYLMHRTDNIALPIMLHALKNGIAFYFLFINPEALEDIASFIF